MGRVPVQGVLLVVLRIFVNGQLLRQLQIPVMIDIELLASGEGPPGAFLLDLVGEGRVGASFLDVAIPALRVRLYETLWAILEAAVTHPLRLGRIGEDKVAGVFVRGQLPIAGPVRIQTAEITWPFESAVVVV